jgi:hypothetical protein
MFFRRDAMLRVVPPKNSLILTHAHINANLDAMIGKIMFILMVISLV